MHWWHYHSITWWEVAVSIMIQLLQCWKFHATLIDCIITLLADSLQRVLCTCFMSCRNLFILFFRLSLLHFRLLSDLFEILPQLRVMRPCNCRSIVHICFLQLLPFLSSFLICSSECPWLAVYEFCSLQNQAQFCSFSSFITLISKWKFEFPIWLSYHLVASISADSVDKDSWVQGFQSNVLAASLTAVAYEG